ncbi:MAG: glucosaminidase domain-containing protein [Treponema sp.]|jgi:hypothetical protein|nr:glucosaminidase domain-containing protein [Treponema sp.]
MIKRSFIRKCALPAAAWLALCPLFAEQNSAHIFDIPETFKKADAPEIDIPAVPENSARDAEESGRLPEISGAAFADKNIMGRGETGADILSLFLLSVNGGADPEFVRELAACYTEEAEAEGVNHDIAFAQMCLETGFLRYGGLVTADMNNFCGLGSIGPGEPGESFSSARIGVRAHIQHLKTYATNSPLNNELVDPRRRWVRQGSAPVLKNLSGTWAADPQYSYKIGVILGRLYTFKPDF